MKLYQKTAAELSCMLHKREITACEILDDTFARIEAAEPQVDAFLSVTADTAYAKARAWMKSSGGEKPLEYWPASLWALRTISAQRA